MPFGDGEVKVGKALFDRKKWVAILASETNRGSKRSRLRIEWGFRYNCSVRKYLELHKEAEGTLCVPALFMFINPAFIKKSYA